MVCILQLVKVEISLHWHRNFTVPTMYLIFYRKSRNRHHTYIPCLSLLASSHFRTEFQELDIVQLTSPALLAYLQERGINTALAKRECKEARFTHNGKRYFAIAFPNISGGYEIRNRYFKGCIAPKEISHIRQSGKPRSACYVLRDYGLLSF